jgi:hypothetical protein
MRIKTNMGTARRSSFGGLLFFTLFWCALTGVFVGFIAHSFWRSADAKLRYVPTTGTILSSQVTSSSDSDGTTYGFGVRYRYIVSGQTFESDRYAFGAGKSSDGHKRASELVRRHPVGSTFTVYYDPAKPQEAVVDLKVDPTMLFMLLFMQPFVLVGVGMLGAVVTFPFRRRSLNRFLQKPADVPWQIPTWGTLERGFGGFTLTPRRGVTGALIALLFGWGLASFISIFVVGFLFGGFAHPRPGVIGGAIGLAVSIGVLSAVFSVRSQKKRARLVIDPTAGLIKLTSPLRQVELAFDEVAGWSLKQILNPRNVKQEGQSAYVPLLSIHTTKGEDVPVHIFGADEDAPAVAQKVAETFATWTNKPLFEDPPPSSGDMLKLMTISGALAAAREIKAAAAQFKDLC